MKHLKKLLFEMTPECRDQYDLPSQICVDVEALVSRLEVNGPRLPDRRKRSVMSSATVTKETREHSWTEVSWKEIRTA